MKMSSPSELMLAAVQQGLNAKAAQLAVAGPLRLTAGAGATRAARVASLGQRSVLVAFLHRTFAAEAVAEFKRIKGEDPTNWVSQSDRTIPTEVDVLRVRHLARFWVSFDADREDITQRLLSMADLLAPFRPTEAVRVFRNEKLQGEDGWKEQYDFASAWSTDIYDAKVFGDVDRRLVTAIAQPEDILVSVPMVDMWARVYDLGIVDAEKADEVVIIPQPSFENDREEVPDDETLAKLRKDLWEPVVDAWRAEAGEVPPNALAEAAKLVDGLQDHQVPELEDRLKDLPKAKDKTASHNLTGEFWMDPAGEIEEARWGHQEHAANVLGYWIGDPAHEQVADSVEPGGGAITQGAMDDVDFTKTLMDKGWSRVAITDGEAVICAWKIPKLQFEKFQAFLQEQNLVPRTRVYCEERGDANRTADLPLADFLATNKVTELWHGKMAKLLQPKAAAPKIPDLQPIMQEFLTALDPEGKCTPPKIRYVSNSSNTLGLCHTNSLNLNQDIVTGANSDITLQKGLAVDLNHLRKVVAHEVCHHVAIHVMVVGKPLKEAQEALAGIGDGHGTYWQAEAEKINARYGAGFVTQTSDMNQLEWESRPAYLFILQIPSHPRPAYCWAPTVSSKIILRMDDYVQESFAKAYVVKTTNRFLTQPHAKGPEWSSPVTKQETEALQAAIAGAQGAENLFASFLAGDRKTRKAPSRPWTLIMINPKRGATGEPAVVNAWALGRKLNDQEMEQLKQVREAGIEFRRATMPDGDELRESLPKLNLNDVIYNPGRVSPDVYEVQTYLKWLWNNTVAGRTAKLLQPKVARPIQVPEAMVQEIRSNLLTALSEVARSTSPDQWSRLMSSPRVGVSASVDAFPCIQRTAPEIANKLGQDPLYVILRLRKADPSDTPGHFDASRRQIVVNVFGDTSREEAVSLSLAVKSYVMDNLIHEFAHMYQCAFQGLEAFGAHTPSPTDRDEGKAYGAEMADLFASELEQNPKLTPEAFIHGYDGFSEIAQQLGPKSVRYVLRDLGYIYTKFLGEHPEVADLRRKNVLGADQDVHRAPRMVQVRAKLLQPKVAAGSGATNAAGAPIHPTPEGIANFWRWFGASKTVDSTGQPMVFHHGTPKGGFDAFDPKALGSNTGSPSSKLGFFFTPDLEAAATYANMTDPTGTALRQAETKIREALYAQGLTGKIYTGYSEGTLFMAGDWRQRLPKNPTADQVREAVVGSMRDRLEVYQQLAGRYKADVERKAKPKKWELQAVQKAEQSVAGGGKTIEIIQQILNTIQDFTPDWGTSEIKDVYLRMLNPLVEDHQGRRLGRSFAEVIADAKEGGHDGAVILNTEDPNPMDVYVVFEPTQIKGVENSGSFDQGDARLVASQQLPSEEEVPVRKRAKLLRPKVADYAGEWMRGRCFDMAVALHRITGLPMYGLFDDGDGSPAEGGDCHHAFVYDAESGMGIDARGEATLADLSRGCAGTIPRPIDLSVITKGVGRPLDPGEVSEAARWARKHLPYNLMHKRSKLARGFRVYLDLDDTLAAYSKAAKEAGVPPDEWLNVPGAFRHLEVLPGAKEAVAKLQRMAPGAVYILSKPADDRWEESCQEKREWMAEEFPSVPPGHVQLVKDKGAVGRPQDLLLDDHTWNGADRFPGTLILFAGPQSWGKLFK